MEKFRMIIDVDEDGSVNIKSEGVCHHVYLVGILESIKSDVLNAAANMDGEAKMPQVGQDG